MIEVIFIGTGPSIPLPGKGNTSFVVRSAHSTVLVECGPTVQLGAQNAGLELNQIPYLFISHRHGDHMLCFPMIILDRLIAGRTIRPAPLHVFCPAGMVDFLKRFSLDVYPEIRHTLESVTWYPLPEDTASTVELEPDLTLTAMPVGGPPHTPTLGLRLDFKEGVSVAYSADTAPDEEVPKLAEGCDLLIHEAYFDGSPPRFYHSTGRSAGSTARRAGCRMLALVHLGPSSYGREDVWAREANETFFGEIIIPSDGDVIRINAIDK